MGLKTNGDHHTTTVNVVNGIMPAECLTVQLQHLHYLHHHHHQHQHQLVTTHRLHHKIHQVQQQPRLSSTHAVDSNAPESYDVRQNLHKIIVRMFSKQDDDSDGAASTRQENIWCFFVCKLLGCQEILKLSCKNVQI